ncbi:MAG: branched-chain amino acid transport system II carrier protein [Alphaproteobacteria bacterium]|nr:branched-chain amino acid transport system II carrier protein [Alphaproteobacteria bacterium]
MLMRRHIFIYGFSMFSMFFGSGNLVFPLQIGLESGSAWVLGFLGLFLTGIILPFLGLFVIKLHQGSYNAFFAEAGKSAGFFLPLFTLSLLGAFGVVPRCITVAHGGIEYIFKDLSLIPFSFLFCAISYLICLKDTWMITILGKWLTPILLTSLAVLICLGVIYAPISIERDALNGFSCGFHEGYKTMDLFAAFFFSALVFKQLQQLTNNSDDPKAIIKTALKPSLLGASLLAIVYFGFVYLGMAYSPVIDKVSPELMLPAIASHIMGDKASLIIGITVVFSCLTTAVALNNIYARYLCGILNLKETAFPYMLLATTIISFLVSLLDFKGIAAFLGPILEVSYPGLIVLTVMSICVKDKLVVKKLAFYGITVLMLWHRYG